MDIDFGEEGGSFTITSEEGQAFGFDVDDQVTPDGRTLEFEIRC